MEGRVGRWAGRSEIREGWHLPGWRPQPQMSPSLSSRAAAGPPSSQGPRQRAAPPPPPPPAPQCLDTTSVRTASPEASGTVLITDRLRSQAFPLLRPWQAARRETVVVTAVDMRTRPEAQGRVVLPAQGREAAAWGSLVRCSPRRALRRVVILCVMGSRAPGATEASLTGRARVFPGTVVAQPWQPARRGAVSLARHGLVQRDSSVDSLCLPG